MVAVASNYCYKVVDLGFDFYYSVVAVVVVVVCETVSVVVY